ncbi:MAG: 2-amino-4-hydroxy-6-hydroxymethyldihydropteridine diphosphokinase [Acidobacteriota bacterium]
MTLHSDTSLIALGAGSNLALDGESDLPASSDHSDDRVRALEAGRRALDDPEAGRRVLACSSLHDNDPVDVPGEQPPYLNACILVEEPGSASELLAACREIERRAGRRSKGDRAPRPLDLDLLCCWTADGRPWDPLEEPGLVLPHPRLGQRRFVLQPLAELVPDRAIAGLPGSVAELLAALPAEPALRPGPVSPCFPWRAEDRESAVDLAD